MKVIGLAGWSGAGKTTLLTRVIPHLLKDGLRVSVIKHAHHAFDVDIPGKDSWRHRQSGATDLVFTRLRADRKLLERAREEARGLLDYEGPLNDDVEALFRDEPVAA